MWAQWCGLAVVFALAFGCGPEQWPAGSVDELYDRGEVRRFYLWLDRASYEQLRAEPRQYVRARFSHGGREIPAVGVRFKGHRSMRSWNSKPALKIRFDKYEEEQTFLGLRKMTLNNMVEDPTMYNEMLGYDLYDAMGVATPRRAYAEVFVNGEPYGIYLNLENMDSPEFLARHFDDPSGELFEGEYGCDLYSEDTEGFQLELGGAKPRKALRRLCEVAETDPERLFRGPDAAFAVDQVLSYIAVSAFIGDFDGYRHSHNYRLYHEPTVDRWFYLPWGIDRVMRKHLSIYDIYGRAAQLCFADADCRRAYVARMQDVITTFASIDWTARREQLAALVDPIIGFDKRRPYSQARMAKKREELAEFLRERPDSVSKETACLVDGELVDRDGDGYACDDCDDTNADVHPGALERCDEVDNDCSGRVDDAPTCPCERVKIGRRRFRICGHPMSWQQAAEFCEAQGHTLARVGSKRQAKDLHKALEDAGNSRAWIGLSDADRDGEFEWRDGRPLKFTRWGKRQPNNDGCSEYCVAFKKKGRGHWYSTHCGVRRPFVCRE